MKGAAEFAAGSWMVGPPSSWSSRDQEDFDLAVAFGGLPAHRLSIVMSADPVLRSSADSTSRAEAQSVPQGRIRHARGRTHGCLAVTTPTWQLHVRLSERSAGRGGERLFNIAFVLLVASLLGVLSVYLGGDRGQVFLLIGLMLLSLAFLSARCSVPSRRR